MITKDIYGKTLSNSFQSAITSGSQFIKPKMLIHWLESKHNTNVSVATDIANKHSSEAEGDLGHYFKPEQGCNGTDRQSFLFGVTDIKDTNGHVIRADGSHVAMPSTYSEDENYGWWSGTQSTASINGTYGGYDFNNDPRMTITFNKRECNRIRVVSSEYHGQIHTYNISVFDTTASGIPFHQDTVTLDAGEWYYDHFLPASLGHTGVNKIEIEVITTKNPTDFARIQDVNVIFEADVSDDLVAAQNSEVRDLHQSELPIAGSGVGTVDFTLDNTDQKYNPFSTTNLYGQYLEKNLKISFSLGWQIVRNPDESDFVDATLTAALTDSGMTLVTSSTDYMPDGGAGDEFVVTIAPDKWYREHVLVSAKSGSYDLTVSQRGYAGTKVRAHSAGEIVRFDSFEYPAYRNTYVDEWQGKFDDMSVRCVSTDWAKFAAETNLTQGFLLEGVTVGEAVENLMQRSKFPRSLYTYRRRFHKGAVDRGAIMAYKFSETGAEKNAAGKTVAMEGLRARFFNATIDTRDIRADALDRPLTDLEKALGYKSDVYADYTDNTYNLVGTDTNDALSVTDITYVDKSGDTRREFFNAVFDGFYVPLNSGNQNIGIDIAHGGARIYLDDTLILDEWRLHEVGVGVKENVDSETVNLTAGKAYKLRVEIFYEVSTNSGDQLFDFDLTYNTGGGPVVMAREQCFTNAMLDYVGAIDSPYTAGSADRNKMYNYGVYVVGDEVTHGRKEASPVLGNVGNINSDSESYAVNFNGKCWGRIPYDSSWDMSDTNSVNYTGKWSVELYGDIDTFAGDGEYLSMFDDGVAPTGGWELFSQSGASGIRIETSSGVETVSAAALSGDPVHIVATFDGTDLRYYVDGVEKNSLTLVGTQSSWANQDLTIAARGAGYTSGVGEDTPTTLRNITLDHFALYNHCLTAAEVADRYTEAVMEPLTVYPFLYGNEKSVRDVIKEITLADLGRFYIDETNVGRYEHFYELFEPSIASHASIQLDIDDDNEILGGDYSLKLQTNKVTVKVTSGATLNIGRQGVWRASNPTTLAVVNLASSINDTDVTMDVSTTTEPPFKTAGYLVIDDEIVKYSSKTDTSFGDLERGVLGTTAASHLAGTKVREVRYWDLKYNKVPAFNIKDPFITGIRYEEPDEINILKWHPGNYGAELAIAASNSVPTGTFVFAEGVNPLTNKVAYTAISGVPVVSAEQNEQVKEQTASNTESIRKYGLKEIVIESPYITDFVHAQKIADFIISKMSGGVDILNLRTMLTPTLQNGDRVRITAFDALEIVNLEFWVVSKTVNYGPGPEQNLVLRRVS